MKCPQCHESMLHPSRPCPACGTDPRQLPTRTDLTPTAPLPKSGGFRPGDLFAGRFTIIEKLGEGGMGVVFKAIDRTLDKNVALKIIQPHQAGNPGFIERFKREVRLTQQITHPNVCRVYDLGEQDGTYYLSMQWIDGETLRKLLRQAGRLEQDRALEIAEKIARALGAAHAKGIIHRDLKPENIMLGGRGTVYVMDFGLAKDLGSGSRSGTASIGTPDYMAPEQLRGEKVDERTDLYSLGLIIQEMLTGKPPSRKLGPAATSAL